jgi:hypothetical protein
MEGHSTIISQKRADYALGYQHGSDERETEPDASNTQHPKAYYDGFIKGAKDRAKALPKHERQGEPPLFGPFALAVLTAVIAVVAAGPTFALWLITPNSIRYPALYSWKYSVPFSSVHVDRQPKDCEWSHAPIGEKDCHYRKDVETVRNDSGRITDIWITWKKVPE